MKTILAILPRNNVVSTSLRVTLTRNGNRKLNYKGHIISRWQQGHHLQTTKEICQKLRPKIRHIFEPVINILLVKSIINWNKHCNQKRCSNMG